VSDDPVLARVEAIVAAVAGPLRQPDAGGPDTPLGESGFWLDSVDLLEIVLACEREFDVVFDPDLVAGALGTARTLADLIRSVRSP
jgi:acyl carrier protein